MNTLNLIGLILSSMGLGAVALYWFADYISWSQKKWAHVLQEPDVQLFIFSAIFTICSLLFIVCLLPLLGIALPVLRN